MIAELVALALSGPLDRLRGDARHILGARILDKIALGVCMAVLAGYPHPTLWAALIVAAMIAGMSPSWGAPMGAALGGRSSMPKDDLEWWQVGVLARSVPLALVARGAIWGAPVAAMERVVNEHQTQIDQARADADAAASAGERLRQRVAELTAGCRRAAGGSAVAGSGQAADATARVLADVQRRLDAAADRVARHADEARAAGLACERAYGALSASR